MEPFKTKIQADAWAHAIWETLDYTGRAFSVENIRESFQAFTQISAVSKQDIWQFSGTPEGTAYDSSGPIPQEDLQEEATTIVVRAALEVSKASDAAAAVAAVKEKYDRLLELAEKTGMVGSSGALISSSMMGGNHPAIEDAAASVTSVVAGLIAEAARAFSINVDEGTIMGDLVNKIQSRGVTRTYELFLLQMGVGSINPLGLKVWLQDILETARGIYQRTSAPPTSAVTSPITFKEVQAAIAAAVASLTTGRVYVYQLPDGTITRQGAGIIAPPGSKLLRVENEAQVAYVDTSTGRTVYLTPGASPPPNYVRKENVLIGGTRYSPTGAGGVTPGPGRRGGSSGYSPPAGVVIKTPEQLRPAQPATVAGSAFIVLPRAFARKPPTSFTYELPAGEAARVEKEKFSIPNMGFSPAGSKFNRF